MGWTLRPIELRMELEIIKSELQKIGDSLVLKTRSVECYLFGSLLKDPKKANDVDVLIVYENQNHLQTIKQEFKLLAQKYPLHISYFTFSEEKEFNFIDEQKAEKIFCF